MSLLDLANRLDKLASGAHRAKAIEAAAKALSRIVDAEVSAHVKSGRLAATTKVEISGDTIRIVTGNLGSGKDRGPAQYIRFPKNGSKGGPNLSFGPHGLKAEQIAEVRAEYLRVLEAAIAGAA